MSALGSLVVSLSLEHAAFTKGLDKSSQEALQFAKNNQDSFDRFSRSATKSFDNVVRSAGAAVAAFTSVSTVINQLSNSIRFADEMNDIAKANEVAISSILKLSQALSLNGGNAADATKFLSSLTASIDEAAQGSDKTQKRFADLGVTLNDLRTLDGQAIFEKTLQGLNDIEDPIKRNAAAMDLFGKAAKGVDILGLVADYINNKSNFGEAEKSFKDIGVAMDKLDVFTTNVKTSLATLAGAPLINAIDYTEKYGLTVLKALPVIGRMVDLMERYVDAQNAAAGNTASGKIKKVNETPAVIRDVIDAGAEKAAQDAKRLADKAAQDAKKRAEDRLRELQDQVNEEFDNKAAIDKYQYDLDKAEKKRNEDAAEDEYKRQLKVMDIIQDQANKNFDEAQKRQKELADEAAKASESINQSLTDALLRGFESGKGFAKNFRDTLVNMFRTLVLQPIISFLIDSSGITKLLGSVGTLLTSGGASSASGNGTASFSNVFGGLKDIISAGNGSIVSSIQDLGVFLSTGNGGLGDTLGGFIGQYSAQIADVLPYAGAFMQLLGGDVKGAAFTAAGTAIGSIWGPIGGAIGGALGSLVGGLFGGEKIPRFSSQSVTKYSNGQYTTASGTPMYDALGATAQTTGLNEAFIKTLLPLMGAYGINDQINAQTRVVQKRKNSYAEFWSSGGGTSYAGVQGDAETTQKTFEQLVDKVLSLGVAKYIKTSSLPEGVKKFFDGLTKKEDVADAINTLVSLKAQLKDLPDIFDAVRNAINTTAYDTTIAQLKAQFQATQTFVNLFYSDTEKFNIFTKQLTTQLSSLNETLPTSRDEYRALVESINVVDSASRDQYNGLIALAPAMDEYFKQLQSQKDIVEQTTGALRDLNSFTSLAEYRQYKGVSANYGATLALDNTANYRSGNLSNSLSGQGVVTGDKSSDVVSLLKELRDYMKQNVIAATNSADLLDRFDRAGMPARV